MKTSQKQVIEFLLSLGLSPLPVAPKQDADRYPASYKDNEGIWQPRLDKDGNRIPRFTGKNPSYIDAKGMPRIVRHSDYQDKKPTEAELATWFANPDTGVGALGTDHIIWLDFDVKQFENQEECANRFDAWLEAHPSLKYSWIEQTHSGGYRVAVKVPEKPSFTNFSLDGVGGKHHGEGLGYGRFTVLSPTIGVSGNPYVCLNLATPVEVESLESIGIFPVKKEKIKVETARVSLNTNASASESVLNFEQEKFADQVSVKLFISKAIQSVMGDSAPPDRSAAFVRVAREIFGWSNWLSQRGIGIIEDIQKMLLDVASNMGLETRRFGLILDSIDATNCLPGLHYTANDSGCWGKLKKHCIDVFKKLCPEVIKEILKLPVKHTQMMPNGIEFQSSKYFSFEGLNKYYSQKKYTSTEIQNSAQIDLSHIKKTGVIISIKAAMGGRKTETCLDRIWEGSFRAFWIAPRTKLIIQTVYRAGEKQIRMYLVNEQDGIDLLLDDSTHLALCGESLHKLDGRFVGADIYIDEVVTVLKQLLSGGTVSGSMQGLILQVFKKMIREANSVVVCDANLTDDAIKLLASFAPDKEVVKIENIYKRGVANIQIIETTVLMSDGSIEIRKRDKSPLIERLLNSPEEKFVIPCDSKRTCNDVESLMFDAGRWGFNLNQETSEETWNELFIRQPRIQAYVDSKVSDRSKKWSDELLNDPNTFLLKYCPNFFVYSPTAETGVSITAKYFTQIVVLFCGVLTADSQSQMLFRVRDLDIPRVLHCPEIGLKTETSYPCKTLREAAFEAQRAIVAECYPEIDSYEEVSRLAEERLDKDWLEYAYKIQTTEHFEKDNLRSCLTYQLRSMGHTVQIVEDKQNKEVNDQIKIVHCELLELEAKEIFEAVEFEDLDTAKEAFKKVPNKANALRKEKTRILTSLPGIQESYAWSQDFILECFVKDKHCLRMNDRYWLLMNPEVEEKSNDFWNYIKLSSEFITESSLANEHQVLILGLRKLGIDTLIEELENGFTFTKDSPQIQAILSKARKDKNLKAIKQFQPGKETIHKKEVVEFIKSLLSLVGLKLEAKERVRGEAGIRTQWYGLKAEENSYKPAILDGIEKKYAKWIEEKYIKPDWDYLKKEGRLPEEFRNSVSPEDAQGHSVESIEEELELRTLCFDGGSYQLPDKHILKIYRKYLEVLAGTRDLSEINYSQEALDKATTLMADAERFATVREVLSPLSG